MKISGEMNIFHMLHVFVFVNLQKHDYFQSQTIMVKKIYVFRISNMFFPWTGDPGHRNFYLYKFNGVPYALSTFYFEACTTISPAELDISF